MGGSHDPNQVCVPGTQSRVRAGGAEFGVGMLSAVSAKGIRGRLGGTAPLSAPGQMRGVGERERAEGGPGTAFPGSELPGGRGERRAGSGSSKAAPEVIKLEKQLGGATQRLPGPIQFQTRTRSWAKKLERGQNDF